MKERTGWGALGAILMTLSFLTFLNSPENIVMMLVLPLPIALNLLLASGVIMTSISFVGLLVERL